MKNGLSGIMLAGLVLLATPAAASQILVTVNGTLTSSRGEGNPLDSLNNGIDPNLAVGDVFTLTASFDSSLLLDAGGGTQKIGMYSAPISGDMPMPPGFLNGMSGTFFRIDAPGMTWQSTDDLHDGFPPFSITPREASPIIYIQGDKVIGLTLDLWPTHFAGRPLLEGGGSQFSIDAPHGAYFNIYNTPGFNGVWDLANSSVAVVPEPATWSLFLLGFGGIGWRVRRRRIIPLLGAKPV